jgi:hypothetical protein
VRRPRPATRSTFTSRQKKQVLVAQIQSPIGDDRVRRRLHPLPQIRQKALGHGPEHRQRLLENTGHLEDQDHSGYWRSKRCG